MDEKLIILVMLMSLFTAASFVVWVIASTVRRSRAARAMVDLQTKMLEKMSPAEMAAYANSDAGRAAMSLEAAAGSSPHGRILNSVQFGVALLLLGMVLWAGMWWTRAPEKASVLASAVAAVGAGLLISAGITYKLSRNWGLFDPKPVTRP